MEQKLQALRRENLKAWLKSQGGSHAACKAAGLPKSSESHISQILSGYTFGGNAARNMERRMGIAENSLDAVDGPTSVAVAETLVVSVELSPQATELALLFDLLKDRRARAKVYGLASAVILDALQESPA